MAFFAHIGGFVFGVLTVRLFMVRPPLTTALLMTDEEFEEHVRAALDSLPDEIARGLENVAVVVEDESPESPEILGSFFGYPRGATMPSGALPAKIVDLPPPARGRVSRTRTSSSARSGSPSSTSSRTTSGSTRTGSPSSATHSGSRAERVAIAAAIVGGIVILLFFFGSRD